MPITPNLKSYLLLTFLNPMIKSILWTTKAIFLEFARGSWLKVLWSILQAGGQFLRDHLAHR